MSVAVFAGKVTNKADMFSFGVLLWEIITVERPVRRGNLRDIMYAFDSSRYHSCQYTLTPHIYVHAYQLLVLKFKDCKQLVCLVHPHVAGMSYIASLPSAPGPKRQLC